MGFATRYTVRRAFVDPVPATRTWTVDATPPDTIIGGGPKKLTRARAATFSFSGQDALTAAGELVFVCSLDGGAATACTSLSTLSGVADGRHTFSAVAVDRAGNHDATPAEHRWTVDASPPANPRVRGPHTTGARRPTYRLSSYDALTARRALAYLCAVDRRTLRRCSPVFRPTLRPGRHVIRVAAVDAAGNRSAITRFSLAVTGV
jgi:large repetitive protein